MKKLREIALSPLFLMLTEILLTAAVAVGAVFYVQANVACYRLWKVVLIDLTFLLCCGGLFALVFFEKNPEGKALYLLFPFLVGAGVFAFLFFLSQALLLRYVNATVASFVGVFIALSFDLACVSVADAFAVRRNRRFYLLATVALTIGVYIGAILLAAFVLPHGLVFKSLSKDKHEFEVQSAEAYLITDADRAAGIAWMNDHLTGENASPAFDFSLGGTSFRGDMASWTSLVNENQTDEEGNRTFVKSYAKAGLVARMEAKYYSSTATVEWTVYLTNTGEENSATVSDFYAMNASLPVSSPTLYFSAGSNEANDDFALYSRTLGKKEAVFDTVNGRSSALYLPFFNLSGKEGGATVGIGWSGQWTAVFSSEEKTSVKVGQSALCGYLAPGETIRTPLVSVCLYSGGNPLKGFNAFRADIKRGLQGRAKESSMLMFAGAEGQDDTAHANIAGVKAYLDSLSSAGVLGTLDYAWFDAGWYDTAGTGDWRGSVGDWIVDPAKYPEGLGAVSAALEEKGVGMLLWYEPERVPTSSALYQSISAAAGKERWLIRPTDGSADCLWNMGDPDALQFMIDYISDSLIKNGVSYYRQDYNISPKSYWESADALYYDGRTGFAENKYVTGEYAFLDALLSRIPGLLIDNCASGGKRIDLETCRRSVPLWRSDYQCKKEKTDLSESAQYQLYGLGMWLPYSCITNPNATTEYDFRSFLGGYVMCYGDVLFDAKDAYLSFVHDYERIKTYFAENYYPLTPCTPRTSFAAMQFGTEKEGVILVYSREGARGQKTLRPNGLQAEKRYIVSTVEGFVLKTATGKELLEKGFSVNANEKEATIILYKEA